MQLAACKTLANILRGRVSESRGVSVTDGSGEPPEPSTDRTPVRAPHKNAS